MCRPSSMTQFWDGTSPSLFVAMAQEIAGGTGRSRARLLRKRWRSLERELLLETDYVPPRVAESAAVQCTGYLVRFFKKRTA